MLYKVTLTTRRREEIYIEANGPIEAQQLARAYTRVITQRPDLEIEVLASEAAPANGPSIASHE